MEDFKAMSEVELKQKELVIEELEKERKEIEDSIEEDTATDYWYR